MPAPAPPDHRRRGVSMEGTADLATIAELAGPARLPGPCDRVPCAGRARPRRRGASAALRLGAHGRGDGHVQQTLPRRRVHRRRSARQGLSIRHNGSGHVFRQPPAAGRRGCHPRGSARRRREPDRRAALAAAEYMATGPGTAGLSGRVSRNRDRAGDPGNPTVAHAAICGRCARA